MKKEEAHGGLKEEPMRTPETPQAASLIGRERVQSSSVYRSDGTKIGEIKRLVIDKIVDEIDAGLLIYRTSSGPEILLTHPGGPFWSKNDEGCWSILTWSIPKAIAEPNDLLARAQSEFANGAIGDGGFISLDPIEQKNGKILRGLAVEADLDLKNFCSNAFSLEWPPCSGQWQTFPEIDRIGYFALRTALRKILPYQWPLLLDISEKLGWRITGPMPDPGEWYRDRVRRCCR
jgi:predicted NUDIX family NTP pyrophosphohydrolase